MAKNISLSDIVDNPFQPRTSFDKEALRSLADEMKAEGFWNGNLQGRRKNGKVELVFGHRRLRALRLLKQPTVAVELLELTDAQMALRSLAENLQREGLTDLEKADAVKKTVEITTAARVAAGLPTRGVIQEVADRLGLSHEWVSTLCKISVSMDTKHRAPIEAGDLTAKTAHAAKEWGGDTYVQTLAKQGKKAKTDNKIAKPTHMTVAAMKSVVKDAPEVIQETLKAEIIAGYVVTPQEAEQRARRLASQKAKGKKASPPDLRAVITGWTHRIKDWEQQMRDVAPYMNYVEEVPVIAERFRTELRKLIDTAKQLL